MDVAPPTVDGSGVTSSPEILLFDISRIEEGPVNDFKAKMYTEFGIGSSQYEHLWEFVAVM